MVKLLLCLAGGVLVAVLMLQLRQQRLELSYQANRLHHDIEAQQARLWNQQMQIAVYTAPNAIAQTVGHLDADLVPQSPDRVHGVDWIRAPGDDAAE